VQWFGHFFPDCHLYSTANTTCPTEDGRKRKGHPTVEELSKYADPLVNIHNVFREVRHPFAYTLENPATGRLSGRQVGGRISSRPLWLDLEFSVLIKIYSIIYKSFQCRVDVDFFNSNHEVIFCAFILHSPSSSSRWWRLYMLCIELTITHMVYWVL
jgi:hypothetical protein